MSRDQTNEMRPELENTNDADAMGRMIRIVHVDAPVKTPRGEAYRLASELTRILGGLEDPAPEADASGERVAQYNRRAQAAYDAKKYAKAIVELLP